MLSSNSSLDISLLLKKRYAALAELLEPVAAQVDFPGDAAKASMILKKRDFKRWSVKFNVHKLFLPVLVFRRHLDLPFFFSITWEHINIYDYLWVKLRAKARSFTTHWIKKRVSV